METKHVLTNRDISEQYRDIKLHLMIQDFLGAFSCWATRQDHLGKFHLIAEATQAYSNYLKKLFVEPKKTVIVMDCQKIEELTSEYLFESIPEILALNETSPDFISIGALSRNVYYHILRHHITQPL